MKQAFIAIALMATGWARAHGFDERYDLPVPLAYVVFGACAVVAMTFIAAVVLARRGTAAVHSAAVIAVPMPRALLLKLRAAAWLLCALTIAAALWGSQDPLMNLAPTLVWVVWWVGLAFVAALVDGVWAALDPWRSTFDLLDATARRLGRLDRAEGITLNLHWPTALGQWPAVALLLAWCWLEVVQPLASTPFKLGCAALMWTVCNVGGMVLFGRVRWQAHADVFALVFSTLGRLAPLRLRIDAATPWRPVAGQAGFVAAMLASVVFDSLHGGAAWQVFEDALRRVAPRLLDPNGLVAGTAGLLTVWLAFLAGYSITSQLALRLMHRGTDAGALASSLVLTLLPIALAYNVAHNFSSLVIQGQRVFALLSDPFGRHWDLFGTARWYPDIGLVDARLTWFVAVTAIVAGHATSIWWSHRVVLAAGVPARRAAVAMLPLTLLMLGCTATSLLLIAQPMVFASPGHNASRRDIVRWAITSQVRTAGFGELHSGQFTRA